MFVFLSRVVGVQIIVFWNNYCMVKFIRKQSEECDLVDTNTPLNGSKEVLALGMASSFTTSMILVMYSVSNQPLGKQGKITNADSRSSCAAWPYGFKFLFSCSNVYIYRVCILENLCFGVQMQLQTIQQHFLIICLLLRYKSFCG